MAASYLERSGFFFPNKCNLYLLSSKTNNNKLAKYSCKEKLKSLPPGQTPAETAISRKTKKSKHMRRLKLDKIIWSFSQSRQSQTPVRSPTENLPTTKNFAYYRASHGQSLFNPHIWRSSVVSKHKGGQCTNQRTQKYIHERALNSSVQAENYSNTSTEGQKRPKSHQLIPNCNPK